MRIAVAGGTGVVGRYAAEAVTAGGHEAVVLSRASGVDLRADAGVAEALRGIDCIIDATGVRTTARTKATAFFTEVTGRLQAAGAQCGVQRLVTLSIVGIDRASSYGYYRAKLAHEQAALAGPLPVTIVRATQFHEFPGQLLSRLRLGPVAAMPVMRVQPVAARSVGECLARVATDASPPARVEVAGPQEEHLVEMARRFLHSRGIRAAVTPLPLAGATGRAMRGGALLATPETQLIGPTFESWLGGEDARALAL